MEFQGSFARALFGSRVNFFQRKVVSAWCVGVTAKGAELAMSDTNVGRINVPVDVEIGDVAVFFFAHVIRHPANGQEVRRTIQRDAIVKGKPFTREHFLGNRLQPLIGDRKFAHYESIESFKRAKPPPQRPRTAETAY